jgi:large subunit ribosomal protein L24
MSIRRNDEVLVIAGDDRGKKGKVHRAMPGGERLLVEGVNMLKRHVKRRANVKQAGIIEHEAPIHVSNVMLICTKCNRPTRVGSRILQDKSKVRMCTKCREVID